MSLLSALLDVIVPVLVVAGVGALIGWRLPLDQGTIAKVSLNALTPALSLQTLLTTDVSSAVGVRLIGCYVVVALLAVAVGAAATPGLAPRTRRAVMVAAAIGNNGNMGLPIALFALGRAGLDLSVLIFLGSVVMTFLLAPALYGSVGNPLGAVRAVLRLPTIWAIGAALLIRGAGWHLPLGVARGIELLAQATLPMVLLALGIQLCGRGRVHVNRAVLTAVVARVAVVPLLALGIGLLFALPPLGLQALVLASAMPTAVNAFLLAVEYDGDVPTVAGAVTVSTLVSFGSLAVVTALLPAIGRLAT